MRANNFVCFHIRATAIVCGGLERWSIGTKQLYVHGIYINETDNEYDTNKIMAPNHENDSNVPVVTGENHELVAMVREDDVSGIDVEAVPGIHPEQGDHTTLCDHDIYADSHVETNGIGDASTISTTATYDVEDASDLNTTITMTTGNGPSRFGILRSKADQILDVLHKMDTPQYEANLVESSFDLLLKELNKKLKARNQIPLRLRANTISKKLAKSIEKNKNNDESEFEKRKKRGKKKSKSTFLFKELTN